MNDNYAWGPADGFNANDSETGYSWSNTTEANYTFTIAAVNISGNTGINASNVSMYVDITVPKVNWTNSGYTNLTKKKNSDILSLNISVGDASSGLTNSYCVFDVNGTNETVAVSGGWCNSTQINLTGLADGNHSIDVWANDSVNNVGVNLSYYSVWVDTTVPVVTFACSPTFVYATETIICSCSGTDVGSGVSTTSYTSNPSTSDTGSYTTSCNVTDKTGNSVSSSISYSVGGTKGSSSSSGTPTTWTNTYVVTDEQFKKGFTKELKAKNRMRFEIGGISHHVGIEELTDNTAKIEIASEPQTATLSIGDTSKFEITNDSFYDLSVTLNSIENDNANITILSISEEIISGSETDEIVTGEKQGELGAEKENKNLTWLWVVIGIVVLVIAYFIWKKRK